MDPLQTIAGGTFGIGKSNRIGFGAGLTATPTEQASNLGGASFTEVIGAAVDKVSELQGESSSLSKDFQLEKGDVGLEETMIAMQKASLGFQAAVQVRNKVVQAYNDIMNMPV
ncbi:MAG: flagellar hook-basal body complex protein FliE [Rhodocyclaceae bacterium]|nr:flagellar hook-basal body complex protein FliE [Rhodocyclaceae bacterium]